MLKISGFTYSVVNLEKMITAFTVHIDEYRSCTQYLQPFNDIILEIGKKNIKIRCYT